MKKERVQKFIANSGFCSRRKAEVLIEEKRVKVNNVLIKLGDQCTKEDLITIDGKKINLIEEKIYIVLNKKKGYVSTKSDELNRQTVYDLIKIQDNLKNLFSVGRLDKETSGLLILTNDGHFAQNIIHPSSKIFKTYIVQIDRMLNADNKKKLENGIYLDKIKLEKSQIKRISQNKYEIIISEGRKRQIRRMFEHFNYKIIDLKRIKIGNLDLKKLNIKYGEYKKYSKKELEKLIF